MYLLSIPYLMWLNSIQNEFILWVYKQKRQPRRGSGPLSRQCTASLLLDASSRLANCPRCCSEKRCAAFFKVRCRKKARATTPGNEVTIFGVFLRQRYIGIFRGPDTPNSKKRGGIQTEGEIRRVASCIAPWSSSKLK